MGGEKYSFVSFFNHSNLKHDIQSRISPDIEKRFNDSLQHIRGDGNEGIMFSEVVMLAMAYFFSEIFKEPIENQHYTLENVKGFLDADNKTFYTEIHNVPTTYHKLRNAPLFRACWLIIQTAWFVNSEHFGKHQLIEYLDYYIMTGEKLPIENYEFDKDYLIKKYNDYDKGAFNGNTRKFVHQWFSSILFLVCCELQLPLNGFNITKHGDREYNPLTKCLRLLRPLMPFKVIENDIKNAFASFLDIETGARLSEVVYTRLMDSKNISRAEAKKLFNTVCNSGLKPYMTLEKLKDFFYSCGYSEMQTDRIIQIVTDKDYTFYQAMTEYERQAIEIFKRRNALQGTARIHDAVMYIDQGLRPMVLQTFSTVFFGHSEMNQPVLNSTYYYGKKRLPFAHVSSVPRGLSIVRRKEFDKPPILGNANGFVFYNGKYEYISASFNLNDWQKFGACNAGVFFSECKKMVCIIEHLTNRRLNHFELETIVNHIRENSNHIFDKRYLLSILAVQRNIEIERKASDYGFTKQLLFKKNIDFITAMNEAKRIVITTRNYCEIFDLLSERLENNDYSFLTEHYSLKGRKVNNVLVRYIIRRWNILTSGYVRQRGVAVNSNPLYNNAIKEVATKSNASKPVNKTTIRSQQLRKRKEELKQLELIGNRSKARQLIFIIGQYAGIVPVVDFQKDEVLINQLKADIFTDYQTQSKESIEAGSFDELFPLVSEYELQPLNPNQTDYERI